jgi:hypothetical protein
MAPGQFRPATTLSVRAEYRWVEWDVRGETGVAFYERDLAQ